MPDASKSHRPEDQTRLERVVELARQVLRENGLSDYQIDALLNRQRAPHRTQYTQ